MQHGLPLVEERRYLGQLDAVGALAQPPRDREGRQRADGQRRTGVLEDAGQGVQQDVAHVVVGDAHRDGADHGSLGVAQRHLPARGPAEGALLDARPLAPGQRGPRIGADVPADLGRGGVGVADAPGVDDHDVTGVRGLSDALGGGLDRTVGVRPPGQDGPGEAGLRSGRLGDGERPPLGLLVELVAEGREEESGGERGDAGGDQQLDGEDLGEDAPGPPGAHV